MTNKQTNPCSSARQDTDHKRPRPGSRGPAACVLVSRRARVYHGHGYGADAVLAAGGGRAPEQRGRAVAGRAAAAAAAGGGARAGAAGAVVLACFAWVCAGCCSVLRFGGWKNAGWYGVWSAKKRDREKLVSGDLKKTSKRGRKRK